MERSRSEQHEYEPYILRDFFEKVFDGSLSAEEMYEEAQNHELDTQASGYNLILFQIQEKNREQKNSQERCQKCQDEVMDYLYRFPCYKVFLWRSNTFGILLRGEDEGMREKTDSCLREIGQICSTFENVLNWYAAAGEPVEQFCELHSCCQNVNHIFSFRYFLGDAHILTQESVNAWMAVKDAEPIESVRVSMMRPSILHGFLEKGYGEEVEGFCSAYLESLQESMKSPMFRDYVILHLWFTVLNYMSERGVDPKGFLENSKIVRPADMTADTDSIHEYMENLLRCAMKTREREQDSGSRKGLKRALDYIDHHYMMEELSLNMVASATDFSPNYFSALFSQEMKITFVEYVTEKRMEQAKILLQDTMLRSSEIAPRVGYRDPHYFSYVFKRTQGCTPREYRARTSRR